MELTVDQALQQAVSAHREGKLKEAEELYRAILRAQPLHPDANHNLGVIAVSVNNAEAALPLFKTALKATPTIEQFWLSYIDALIKEKQFDSAHQVLEQAKKHGVAEEKLKILETQFTPTARISERKLPAQKRSQSLSERRKKLAGQKKQKKTKKQNVNANRPSETEINNLSYQFQNGLYDDAEKLAKTITQEFPKHPFAWEVLGAVLRAAGRISEAVDANQKVVALSPKNAQAHSNLGITLQELGRPGEAEASYKQAIALKPDYSDAHNNLGNALQELGRLDEAEASYKQAIGLKSDFAVAHYNLGNTLRELDRLDEAEASYTQAITLQPHYAQAHNNLGLTLHELGRLEEAEASCAQAITLQPDHAHAHNNLGNTLTKLVRLDEAEASYQQAIALKPDFAAAHGNLGSALQELGRLDEAESSYKQAIALEPGFAQAHCNLGNVLKELGRLDEAEASFTQAIALKPDYADAHFYLGVLLFESEEYNLAAAHFQLCDTQVSKLFAIKCSYQVDEETIFYRKFDLLVSQGESNAIIGSLGVQSEFKYGIKKQNPFCNDPLSYVVRTDLSKQCDFEKIFIKTASDVLSDSLVSYRAQGLLTNGVQTSGNILTQGKVPESDIESILRAEIEKYRLQFSNSNEGFIKNWPASYVIKGWLVWMQSGGALSPHIHEKGWISGSVYINVPPKSVANSGSLVLCLSDQGDSLIAERDHRSILDVVTGSLCLFPSSLYHYTIPFEHKEGRIVLAFDVIPKH